MNTQKLLALADHLESMPPERFHMGFYFVGALWRDIVQNYPCGTVCCIAGEAARLAKKGAPHDIGSWFNRNYCLPSRWGAAITMGFWSLKGTQENNPRIAAEALRSAAACPHEDADSWAMHFRDNVYPTLAEGTKKADPQGAGFEQES